jgi:hypothetical protein
MAVPKPNDEISLESLSQLCFKSSYEQLPQNKKNFVSNFNFAPLHKEGFFSFADMILCFQEGDEAAREVLTKALPVVVKLKLLKHFNIAVRRGREDEAQQQYQQHAHLGQQPHTSAVHIQNVSGSVNINNYNYLGNSLQHCGHQDMSTRPAPHVLPASTAKICTAKSDMLSLFSERAKHGAPAIAAKSDLSSILGMASGKSI